MGFCFIIWSVFVFHCPVNGKGKQINLLPKTFHIELPDELIEAVEKCETDKQVREVGIEWCISQCKELIKNNVPCLHFYTMGNSGAVKSVASGVF